MQCYICRFIQIECKEIIDELDDIMKNEYIDGYIWANVYTTDEIVMINPKDGRVEGVIDCRGLLPKRLYTRDTDVLNGIAYDPENDKIYLTGKNWPKMYEVKLVEKK